MTVTATTPVSKGESTRERILDAAEQLMLAKGYSGTSVDEILAATALTKGAFFYHFKSKGDLARVLVERFWRRDYELLVSLWNEAATRSSDPLERMLTWFELFEALFSQPSEAPAGCLFASYLYERDQFDDAVLDVVRDGLREWSALYEERLREILRSRKPRMNVTARELAEIAIGSIEGGHVLSQASGDTDAVARQSRYFRQYLTLLFAD